MNWVSLDQAVLQLTLALIITIEFSTNFREVLIKKYGKPLVESTGRSMDLRLLDASFLGIVGSLSLVASMALSGWQDVLAWGFRFEGYFCSFLGWSLFLRTLLVVKSLID